MAGIFGMSFLNSKTPAEKRKAELKAFGRKLAKFAGGLEDWLADAIDRAEAKWIKMNGGDEDYVPSNPDWLSDPPVQLPVIRRDFALKSVKPEEVHFRSLARLDGALFLQEVAQDMDAQLLVEVRAEKPAPSFWNRGQLRDSYARVFITIDPNHKHAESALVLFKNSAKKLEI